MSLKSRLIVQVIFVLLLTAVLMFAPAGSFDFWQGWVFTGIFGVLTAISGAYFYKRDPRLLERRMQMREPRRQQRQFKMLWLPLWIVTLVLPGLDYHFGWSAAHLGGVPLWLSVIGFVAILAAWLEVAYVLHFNSFASSVIQVEAGQQVVTDGPYRYVRHPMYSGIIVLMLATPFALGSYIALLPAILLIPVLVLRLNDEERVLREELPGYAEYCERTRFRLIPKLF